MLNLAEVFKPKNLDEALELVAQPETVPLGGGTALLAHSRKDVRAVVDLNDLGLDYIRAEGGAIVIGATARLAEIVSSTLTREEANGIVAQAAQRTHANILRNQATAAGTLLAEPAGIFALALVALDAHISFVTGAPAKAHGQARLGDFLRVPAAFLKNGIATEIVIPALALKRQAIIETVARTPRDKPIVAVCAALEMEQGVVRGGAITLGGVDGAIVRAMDAERLVLHAGLTDDVIDRAAMAATSGLEPPGDYRGSEVYRREMVRVLTGRALRELRDKSHGAGSNTAEAAP